LEADGPTPATTAEDDLEAASSMQMAVECPEGVEPGQLVEVLSPRGVPIEVEVPEGVKPGDEFMCDLPAAASDDEEEDDASDGACRPPHHTTHACA
jgi:hypothetical protein